MTTLLFALALHVGFEQPATPHWLTNDVDAGLRAAQRKHARLLVDVGADWCDPCNQLALEVLDAPEGLALLRGAPGVRVDFETPVGQAFTKKYGIINLPTTLVLNGDGSEHGRIEGYEKRDEWLAIVRTMLEGKGGFAATKAAYTATPSDAKAALAYATELLARGLQKDAEAVLSPLMANADANGAAATKLYGRWLLRVNGDAKAAEAHFRSAVERFAASPAVRGFRYWQAKALAKLHGAKAAPVVWSKLLLAKPPDLDAMSDLADFMVSEAMDPTETLGLIGEALLREKRNDERAWLLYLKAQTALRKNDTVTAHLAIIAARVLDMKKAIFINFEAKLNKAGTP